MGRTRRRRAVGRSGGAGGRWCMLRPVARGARGWCMKGFKDFLLRGNVVELAVAVVIGAAFTALVSQFTASFLEPLIALVGGGGLDGGTFTINDQVFDWAAFVNAVITFVIT